MSGRVRGPTRRRGGDRVGAPDGFRTEEPRRARVTRTPLGAMGRRKRKSRDEDEAIAPNPSASFRMLGGTGTITARFMRDSGALWRDRDDAALRARLADDGYVLLRRALDPAAVRAAARCVLRALRRARPEAFARFGNDDAASPSSSDDVLAVGASGLGLLSMPEVAQLPKVRDVLEHPSLFALADALLRPAAADTAVCAEHQSSSIITAKYKWLRAVAGGEFTGVHVDRVFLGGGGHDALVTLWIPLGAVRRVDGPIMVARGSHRSKDFKNFRETYGRSDVGADGTHSGWATDDASQLPGLLRKMNGRGNANRNGSSSCDVDWRTADFEPGDVVALGVDACHMSASNESGANTAGGKGARVRLSCDTRWQPACKETDPRIRVWRRRVGDAVVDEVRDRAR